MKVPSLQTMKILKNFILVLSTSEQRTTDSEKENVSDMLLLSFVICVTHEALNERSTIRSTKIVPQN